MFCLWTLIHEHATQDGTCDRLGLGVAFRTASEEEARCFPASQHLCLLKEKAGRRVSLLTGSLRLFPNKTFPHVIHVWRGHFWDWDSLSCLLCIPFLSLLWELVGRSLTWDSGDRWENFSLGKEEENVSLMHAAHTLTCCTHGWETYLPTLPFPTT